MIDDIDRTEETPCDADESAPTAELTPDEQMAAYEEALKEEDWGHQPC